MKVPRRQADERVTDPVVEAYKAHIDRTLLTKNLKLSHEAVAEDAGVRKHDGGAAASVCTQCGEPLFEGREIDVDRRFDAVDGRRF